jgi:hypothetical protein
MLAYVTGSVNRETLIYAPYDSAEGKAAVLVLDK